ncbi:hypothetical protein NL676_003644 [Syzygium grande]|nr:hypothetical protein NL676_003644 [Syzygium grande]
MMKHLQQELEVVVRLGRTVEESDLLKLNFLDMVVKENFKLHLLGLLLVPRESHRGCRDRQVLHHEEDSGHRDHVSPWERCLGVGTRMWRSFSWRGSQTAAWISKGETPKTYSDLGHVLGSEGFNFDN